MNRILIFTGIFLPFIIACEETTSPLPEDQTANISFDGLSVGKLSTYLAYEKQNNQNNGPGPLTCTGDTLWLSVMEQIGNVFKVEARYTNASGPDTYLFTLTNDSVKIVRAPNTSGISAFITQDFLPLNFPTHQLNAPVVPLTMGGLSQNCFEKRCFGSTTNHEQLGTMYPHLNLLAYFGAKAFGGPGYYMIYSQDLGIVRSAEVNAWNLVERGWDLLKTN